MNARRRWIKGSAIVVAVLVTMTGLGLAFWGTASTPGSGGAAAASTVNSGATPTAVVAGTSITVSWAASTMASGAAVTGYIVKRYDAATLTQQTILTSCTGVVAATTCTESSVPSGSWRYSVTPVVGTNWVGTESAKSPAVSTDTTAPTNSLSLSVTTGAATLSGNTVYYRGAAAGSFKIVNAVADGGSGPASSATAALTGTASGWSHTPATVSTPAGGPYTSYAFSWTAGTSTSPGEVVTGADAFGNTTTTTLSFVNDSTSPTGGSIGATGLVGAGAAYSTSTTLNLGLSKGTDSGSGLAASGAQLLRATATLISSDGVTDGTCGTFGSYTLVATDPAASRTDTVTDQACYRYQYVVADAVGNSTTYTSSSIKVDTTAPTAPNLVFTTGNNTYWPSSGSIVYYRPGASTGGFTVTAAGTDPASGISTYTFPSLGTNWTSSPSGGTDTYSWSGAPAAPGTKSVTITDNATLVSGTASFTLTIDSTAPTTGTVSYFNGAQTSTSVPVTFTTGTDAGSGVGTRLLQRASATLTSGSCGTFGSFSTVATNPTSPYTDTVSRYHCYKYQYVTSDNVGNQGTAATSTNVVKLTGYYDTVMGTTGLLSYWRLGDDTSANDTFTATTGTTLQAHTGETGATWTKNTTISSGDTVITAAGRIRKSGSTGFSLYYDSASQSSADYTVTADVAYLSSITGDAGGVIGRANTTVASGTFYAAIYDRANSAWELYSVVSGAQTLLGSSAQTLTAGTTYHLSLNMVGTSLQVSVDGLAVISATSSTITTAGVGGVEFGTGTSTTDTDSTGIQLDNFRIAPRMVDSKASFLGDYFGVQLDDVGGIVGDSDTSAYFDGVNDYALVNETMTGDFSVEFWFNSTQGTGTGTTWQSGAGLVDANINGNNKDWGTALRSDGKVIVGDGNGTTDFSLVSTTGGYNDGDWHQVVFTRTSASGAMQVYIDGVANGSLTGATGALTSPTISFGRINTPIDYYRGYLDDVSLYNVVLSAATIAAHYTAGSS